MRLYAIQGKMKDFNDRRRSKQPLEYPSAGSTFRRPAGYFAGKLIQDSGMQGATVGGARVSEKHAGFVINGGDATARDIQDLIAKVQAEVLGQYGVALKTGSHYDRRRMRLICDMHPHHLQPWPGDHHRDGRGGQAAGAFSHCHFRPWKKPPPIRGEKENFAKMRAEIDALNAKYDDIEIYLSVESNIIRSGRNHRHWRGGA